MSRDFYFDAAAQRANQIETELAAAKADLMAHKANSDVDSASQTVRRLPIWKPRKPTSISFTNLTWHPSNRSSSRN